jgi:hypothetical protein
MTSYFYKSEAPATVAIVREFYTQRDVLDAALNNLGKQFGGAVARMRDITSIYAGGVKLSDSRELDVHWRRPDDFGYRSIRNAAKPAKGTPKEERAAIKAEHERLQALWHEHCPKQLSSHDYWDLLNVNTGNLLLCGGLKFEHAGVAYFQLGFQINKAEHHANVAAGQPTAGWIEGAVEILPSEYHAARELKNAASKEVPHAN